jgi:hypothetical protein
MEYHLYGMHPVVCVYNTWPHLRCMEYHTSVCKATKYAHIETV